MSTKNLYVVPPQKDQNTTSVGAARVAQPGAAAKVADFDVHVGIEQDVVTLDVAVGDATHMQAVHGQQDLMGGGGDGVSVGVAPDRLSCPFTHLRRVLADEIDREGVAVNIVPERAVGTVLHEEIELVLVKLQPIIAHKVGLA